MKTLKKLVFTDVFLVIVGDFQVVLRGLLTIRVLTVDLGTGGDHLPAARNTLFALRSCFDDFSKALYFGFLDQSDLGIHFNSTNIDNLAQSLEELMLGCFGSDLFEVKEYIFFCVTLNWRGHK